MYAGSRGRENALSLSLIDCFAKIAKEEDNFHETDVSELSLSLTTPLHVAVMWVHVEIVEMLLRMPNADINAADDDRNMTPLR